MSELPSSPSLLTNAWSFVKDLKFRTHLLISIVIRLVLIFYGQWHDAHSEVPYTDIDYKVVTDGARHLLDGASPFDRHTYRYSPVMAYLQLPNCLLHPSFGKLVYATFDILVAVLIYQLVRSELQGQCRKAVQSLLSKIGKIRSTTQSQRQQNYQESDERNRPEMIARASACFWLYNPLTAVISTRGNGDSFSSFFVILTVYLLAKSEATPRYPANEEANRGDRKWLIFGAGLCHGLAIHLRLYPLLFSLAYYLCLSEGLVRSTKTFLRLLLFPNAKQLILVVSTVLSFTMITAYFYRLYGWQYLYEAYLYHFVRKDVRHNFSFYFLLQYLSDDGAATATSVFEKALVMVPQLLLLFYVSLSFGQFRQTLPFCVFALAFVMVSFNSVVTSQYFVWYLALLPLCLNNLQSLGVRKALALFVLWLVGQGMWLLPAYLLEFKTWNAFYWIGVQGVVFFLINNYILVRLIQHYSFTSFKVNFKKLF